MDEQLIALYHRHLASAFDRQMRLADFLERKGASGDWDYDTEAATLAFDKLKFEAPLVGTHADHNNSWLWAWSDRNLKLTITNRALGDAVRVTVHRLSVHALAAPGFSLEPLLGADLTEHAAHILGVVLGRELGYDAYHTIPYKGGRGLALIRDKRLEFTEKHPLRRIITIFPQVLGELPVFDHKTAFVEYAKDYGLTPVEVPGGVKVIDGKDELIAKFDDDGRLVELEGTVQPEVSKPAKKKVAKRKPAAKKSVKKPAKKVKAAAKKVKAAAKKVTKKPAPKPAKKPVKKTAKKR